MTRDPIEPAGFAEELRERTKIIHREAERSGFIANLIRGRATREGYALFLRNLVPAYAAMEEKLERLGSVPLVRVFALPGLRRLPPLQSDLTVLAGASWSDLAVVPAAEAYADAIRATAGHDGLGLVAHAYARYLGDLSGGQILKPVLARNLGLPPDALSFYDFPEITNIADVKHAMRSALDTVPAGSPQAEIIATEAISAFEHNIAVSSAVQTALG